MVKILIVFHSLFGTNLNLANIAKKALQKNEDVEVRVRRTDNVSGTVMKENFLSKSIPEVLKVPIATEEDLIWADAYLFSSPTHSGMLSASMKYFIDSHHDGISKGYYLNKPFTAMTSTGFQHAGDEEVIEQFYTVAQQWGCLIVSPSISNHFLNKNEGNPYGLSFVVDDKGQLNNTDMIEEVMKTFFMRFVAITKALQTNKKNIDESVRLPKEGYQIADMLRRLS